MQHKFLLFRNAVLLLVIGLTSCSRNSHVEYSGRYKQETKVHVSNRAQESELSKLATVNTDETLTTSLDEEPAVNRIPMLKRTTANSVTHDQLYSKNTTKSAAQKAVRSAAKTSTWKAHADYFSTDREMQQGLKQSSGGGSAILYCLLAILLPPLAVALWEDGITSHFWWSILFTVLFWIPGIIYAWIIILS